MKTFVCLFAVIACVSANAILAPAAVHTGTSTQTRSQDAHGNYAFAYNEQHATGGSSRKESGNPHGAVGSYSLNVGDGRQRVVKYVADGLGFRAAISTNEPGTAAQAPADVSLSSPYLPPVAPEPIAHAPLVAAHAPLAVAHAPIAHGHIAHAPIAHAPLAVAHAPALSSYSTSINHAALAHGPALAIKGHY